MRQLRRVLAIGGMSCTIALAATVVSPWLAAVAASSTNFAGALLERLTPTGFVATFTPQPDLAAAQAQEPVLSDQGYAGWQGAAVSAFSARDAWAVGSFTDLRGRVHPAIEHFDGTSWHYIAQPDAPAGSFLTAVKAIASNDAWAVGARYAPEIGHYAIRIFIEHWDGTRWQIVPGIDTVSGDNGAHLDAVSGTGPQDVWVGGASCSIAGETPCTTLFEHWDGTAWTVVPGPAGMCCIRDIAAGATHDAWAVGVTDPNCLGVCPTGLLHWNGATWTATPGAVPSGYRVSSVAMISPSDAWAVGYKDGTSRNGTLFEHWDGTSWHVVTGPTPGHSTVFLNAVAASSSNDVYAVGRYMVPDCCHEGSRTFAEHWDGTAWRIVSTQSPQISGGYFGTSAGAQVLDGLSTVTAVPGAVFALGNQSVEYD